MAYGAKANTGHAFVGPVIGDIGNRVRGRRQINRIWNSIEPNRKKRIHSFRVSCTLAVHTSARPHRARVLAFRRIDVFFNFDAFGDLLHGRSGHH